MNASYPQEWVDYAFCCKCSAIVIRQQTNNDRKAMWGAGSAILIGATLVLISLFDPRVNRDDRVA